VPYIFIFSRLDRRLAWRVVFFAVVLAVSPSIARAQTQTSPFPPPTDLQQGAPLTNQEFVTLVNQLPRHPELRDKIVDDVRKRGIDFPLTQGLRSLVATKSGNDPDLRRALDEAERRRANPTVASVPPAAEAIELLERTRKATLGAADTMPDFLVKQQIVRYIAYGTSRNWQATDHLTIAVSYRQSAGEQYKVLSVNGMPQQEAQERSSYASKLGGTTSTGEYVSILSELFKPETRTDFQLLNTEELRGRRTVVYEYLVHKEWSHQGLSWEESDSLPRREIVVGYRGRVWVDAETNRVLRLEDISVEIPPDFPISAATSTIDYDWVTINERMHLLPLRAVLELTSRVGPRVQQSRNDILFRGYRKFGAEVKITDIDEADFPPDKPEEMETRPATPPVLKPQPKKP
jgi:hypothetical protein